MEARLIKITCGPVPGGHSFWTIRLLEEQGKIEFEEPASREAIRRSLKNWLRPHRSEYRCLPSKADADFVACMEDVLDVYTLPYNPAIPVGCMDEKPYQLQGEARDSWTMRPGEDKKVDSEYTHNGTCSIFAFIAPLGGMHHVSVRGHRTAEDWAEEMQHLSDVMYPDAEKIILIMDNLNTHKISSLSQSVSAGRSPAYRKTA